MYSQFLIFKMHPLDTQLSHSELAAIPALVTEQVMTCPPKKAFYCHSLPLGRNITHMHSLHGLRVEYFRDYRHLHYLFSIENAHCWEKTPLRSTTHFFSRLQSLYFDCLSCRCLCLYRWIIMLCSELLYFHLCSKCVWTNL